MGAVQKRANHHSSRSGEDKAIGAVRRRIDGAFVYQELDQHIDIEAKTSFPYQHLRLEINQQGRLCMAQVLRCSHLAISCDDGDEFGDVVEARIQDEASAEFDLVVMELSEHGR